MLLICTEAGLASEGWIVNVRMTTYVRGEWGGDNGEFGRDGCDSV